MDRTTERLQNLQDFSDLCYRLADFEIDNEPEADARNAGKLVLPHLACDPSQGADLGW